MTHDMGRRSSDNLPMKRMAKMVSEETAQLVKELAAIIADEQRRDSRISDNEVIKIAVMEAIANREQTK